MFSTAIPGDPKIIYGYHVDVVGSYHPTWHLQHIWYARDGASPGTGSSRYRIDFVTSLRSAAPTQGVDTQWEYNNNGTFQYLLPYEKYRLDAIVVQALPPAASVWQEVRRYNLTYAPATESVFSDSDIGQRVLTLRNVQQVGVGGAALPAYTFSYNGNSALPGRNRLSHADNGQGGRVIFWYEWAIPSPNTWQNYHRVSQMLREDTSGQPYARGSLTTYAYNRPAMNVRDFAATVWWAQFPPSGNGDSRAFLARRENTEFRGHEHVTATTYDGPTTGGAVLQVRQTWFHQGTAACQVPVTNNRIDAASTCFQNMARHEAWKGKPYREETRNAAGLVLQRTDTEYLRVSLPRYGSDSAYANAEGDSNHYQRAGLWRSFNGVSRTIVAHLDGVSSPVQTITEQFYAPGGACTVATATDILASFGNLGCTRERDQANTLLRSTTLRYATATSPYIVDKVHQRAVSDGSGNLRAITESFYDSNHTTATVGARGLLTLERAYRNVPAQPGTQGVTLFSRDTASGYDAWGSRTTVTTYSAEGTRLFNGTSTTYTGPSGTPTTTTTAYDDPNTGANESPWGLPHRVTNALGHVDRGTYDYRWQRLISIVDVNNQTTTATYDPFGRIGTVVKPGDTSALPTTQYVYTPGGGGQPMIVRVEARDDGYRYTQQMYDGLGRNVQTKQEGAGAWQNLVTDRTFDGLDRAVVVSQVREVNENSVSFWRYTSPGSALFRPTTTTYDALGRPRTVTTPDLAVTTTNYSFSGALRTVDTIDARNHCTRQRLDSFGRLRHVDEFTGPGCAGTVSTTNYTLDALDQLTQTSDAAGNTTTLWYNTLGRPTTIADPNMGTWNYWYDANGKLVTHQDGNGQFYSYAYDALDRLTTQYPSPAMSDTFNTQSTSAWSWSPHQTVPWNAGGNNVVRSVGTGSSYAASFARSSFSLTHGQRARMRFLVESANTQAHFALESNSSPVRRFGVVATNGGLVVQVIPGDGTSQFPATLLSTLQPNVWYVLDFAVDDINGFSVRVYQESNPAVSGGYQTGMTAGQSWRFVHYIWSSAAQIDGYDELRGPDRFFGYDDVTAPNQGRGRRTSSCVWDGTRCLIFQRWEYDARGRETFAGQSAAGLNHNLRTTYDSADRVVTHTYEPTNEVVTYGYNAAWQQTSLCTNLGGCYAAGATYTALGQPLALTLGGGVSRSTTYSAPMQRVQSIGVTAGATTLLSRSYGYDAVGNITSVTDSTPGSPFGAQTLTYDHRDRLTNWSGTGVSESYGYSATGNLTSKAGVSYSYGANGNGTGAGPYQARVVGGQAYTYDAAGNLLSGGGRSYTWYPTNQPATVTHAGVTEAYSYDADGNRALRLRSGVVTYTAFGVWEQVGAAQRKLYRFGGQLIAQRDGSGAVTYLHGDHLGSVSVTSDGTGGWVQRQFFDPWGRVRSGVVGGVTPNFTGQRLDGTGLLYYNARYYDPLLGRFLSADWIVPGASALTMNPLGGVAGGMWGKGGGGPSNPQDLNRYTYALNNPVRNTDPTGHFAWILGGAAIGAVVNVGVTVGLAAMTGELQTMDSRQIAGMVAEAAVVGAVTGALVSVAGPAAGSAVAAMGATRAGAAVIGTVGKEVVNTAIEGGISLGGSVLAEASGAGWKQLVSGSPANNPDLGQAAATTVADTAIISHFGYVDPGASADTLRGMSRTITPRGNQSIPRALANQRFASSALRVNSGIAIVVDSALEEMYNYATSR